MWQLHSGTSNLLSCSPDRYAAEHHQCLWLAHTCLAGSHGCSSHHQDMKPGRLRDAGVHDGLNQQVGQLNNRLSQRKGVGRIAARRSLPEKHCALSVHHRLHCGGIVGPQKDGSHPQRPQHVGDALGRGPADTDELRRVLGCGSSLAHAAAAVGENRELPELGRLKHSWLGGRRACQPLLWDTTARHALRWSQQVAARWPWNGNTAIR